MDGLDLDVWDGFGKCVCMSMGALSLQEYQRAFLFFLLVNRSVDLELQPMDRRLSAFISSQRIFSSRLWMGWNLPNSYFDLECQKSPASQIKVLFFIGFKNEGNG